LIQNQSLRDGYKHVEEKHTEKKRTPAQPALAWVLRQGEDIAPIPGRKRRRYLEENAAALSLQVTPADLKRIDEVAPKDVAAGLRYP
jgi:aryl-alcohol dehydrogenase-like predicted oxidoreductase